MGAGAGLEPVSFGGGAVDATGAVQGAGCGVEAGNSVGGGVAAMRAVDISRPSCVGCCWLPEVEYTALLADSVCVLPPPGFWGLGNFALKGVTPSHSRWAHTMPTWEMYLRQGSNETSNGTPHVSRQMCQLLQLGWAAL